MPSLATAALRQHATSGCRAYIQHCSGIFANIEPELNEHKLLSIPPDTTRRRSDKSCFATAGTTIASATQRVLEAPHLRGQSLRSRHQIGELFRKNPSSYRRTGCCNRAAWGRPRGSPHIEVPPPTDGRQVFFHSQTRTEFPPGH